MFDAHTPSRFRVYRSLLPGRVMLLGGALLLSGCTLFGSDPAPDEAYERTRAAINDPGPRGNGVRQASFESPEVETKPRPISVEDFSPSQLGGTLKRIAGQGPDRKIAADHYEQARQTYQQAQQAQDGERRKLLEQAAEKFADAANRWPNSAMEQDGLYMAGEAYFFADDLPTANEYYELLLKRFPNTRYLDKVQARRFAIGKYWAQLHEFDPNGPLVFNLTDRTQPRNNTQGAAVKLFEKIRLDDPTGDWADDAAMAAGVSFFTAGDFYRAGSNFADVREFHPGSEHQFMAHFLGLKAKLLSYDGPAYGGTSLDEAEKLIKQIHKQFPQEAKQQQEYLQRAWAEVRYKQAEQQWRRASYYDRRGEYGAARMHYDTVVSDFSDTPFGPRARERRSEIAERPATPPQRLGWLVDLFDSNSRRKLPEPDGDAVERGQSENQSEIRNTKH